MSDFFGIVVLVLIIAAIVISFRKGKPGMAIGGIFTYGVLSAIGAIRLAKPDSAWAWKNYPPYESKMVRSWSRFGADAPPPVLLAPPPVEQAPTHRLHEGDLEPRPEPDPSEAEVSPIPGLDPIADKLRELSSHFAATGSSIEILEQGSSSAEIRVFGDPMGTKSRRYRLTLGPRRRVETEPL